MGMSGMSARPSKKRKRTIGEELLSSEGSTAASPGESSDCGDPGHDPKGSGGIRRSEPSSMGGWQDSVGRRGTVVHAHSNGSTHPKVASKAVMPHRDEERLLQCLAVTERDMVVFARTTGYPFWPAQVVHVDARVAREPRYRRSLAVRRKDDDTVVMYFGTSQFAWVNRQRCILSWEEGIKRELHKSKAGGAGYDRALHDAYLYASDRHFYPRNWWCEPRSFQLAQQLIDCISYAEDFVEQFKSQMVRAEEQRVCWVRTDEDFDWPAQVMLPTVAARKYPDLGIDPTVEIKDSHIWACMMFGTGEVGMFGAERITPLVTGILRDFHLMNPECKFQAALGDLWGYLQKPRVWPSGIFAHQPWWDDERNAIAMAVPALQQPPLPRYVQLEVSAYLLGVQRPPPMEDVFPCNCHMRSDFKQSLQVCTDGDCCMNVASNYFCDPNQCATGNRCANKLFSKRPKPKVSPFFTADDRGWGLKLEEPVKKGTFICEYVGEIIDEERLHQRLAAKRAKGTQDYYIMEIGDGLYVDSEKKGNIARFINSSCDPNCDSQKWTDQATGQTHVGIFAKKDLLAGMELTFNYAFQDFGMMNAQKQRSFQCRCGAPNCKMMNEQERLHVQKLMGKKIRVLWDDGNFYSGKVVNYDTNNKRFRVAYEDGDVELLTLGIGNVIRVPAIKGGDGVEYKIVQGNS